MSSYYLRPIICFALIISLGCAHHPTDKTADVTTAPVLSPAVEAPSTQANAITPVSPPPLLPTAADSDEAPIDTELAGQSPAVPSSVEMPIDDADTGDAAVAEPVSSASGIQQQLDEALDFCEAAQEFWQKGELESALEALDKAYSLILTVEPDDPAKMVQQKEDLRFLISKRILEIYASRNIVVNGNHNAIPREINKNIQKEINLFTKGPERRFFVESYQRSGKYRPMILKKLEAAGLPVELSWVPLIESGFKVQALSRAQ